MSDGQESDPWRAILAEMFKDPAAKDLLPGG
eukprot:SAG31_NODE_19999_length_586_cov_1.675565_1_plen_30_part_10